jgi:hypothetical protein
MARAAQPLTPDFLEEEVTVRGITYHFRELSIGEYDDLVTKATRKESNPLTGDETEVVDNTVLLKLMVLRCCTDPKLTPESLASLPMRVVLKFNQTVNRMHYGDEPATEKKADDAEEGTDQGND